MQDPEASKAWQKSRARPSSQVMGASSATTSTSGIPIPAVEKRDPESARLLADISDRPDFDAVVIAEPQRAFYGLGSGNTYPLFTHGGVHLWVPEVGGPARSR